MARPEKNRNVLAPPLFSSFKPTGVRGRNIGQILLSLDEYEALRLADYDGLEHIEASEKMNISRPTFTRLITRARKKIADFIIEGKILQIEGGAIHFSQNMIKCLNCGEKYQAALNRRDYKCPECGSTCHENLAMNFGHGRCCGRFKNEGIEEKD